MPHAQPAAASPVFVKVAGGIRVSVRIRPLNERELNDEQVLSWECTDTTLECTHQKGYKV